MNTYIVIVTYNGMQWIDSCLSSVFAAQTSYHVIIVDNASSDDTLSFISKKYPQVSILINDENLGFGRANNLGISEAVKKGAKHVFLLNQDAYLVEDALETMIAVQTENPQYGIVTPVHLNGKGDLLDRSFSTYVRYDANPYFYSDFVLNIPRKPIYEVPFVNAAGWLLSMNCLETVGGFDPIFHHYGEDDNYCQRVKYHGFKIGVVPQARLLHDRQDRPEPKVRYGTTEYFKKLDRTTKVRFGNINIENLGELEKLIQKLKKRQLKATLKLRGEQAKNIKKEIELIGNIVPQIQKSRIQNCKKDLSYLDY